LFFKYIWHLHIHLKHLHLLPPCLASMITLQLYYCFMQGLWSILTAEEITTYIWGNSCTSKDKIAQGKAECNFGFISTIIKCVWLPTNDIVTPTTKLLPYQLQLLLGNKFKLNIAKSWSHLAIVLQSLLCNYYLTYALGYLLYQLSS